MKYLFANEGLAALAELAATPTLYAFDFDGTLAPIEARPEKVRTPANVMRLLGTLAGLAPVAVISGRRRADLQSRLPRGIRHLVGNHGNEGGPVTTDEAAFRTISRGWREQLVELLGSDASGRGVQVEDKALSLSLHFRLARDRDAEAARLAGVIDRLQPAPRVIGGKLVFNLLPPGAKTKFEALAAIAAAEQAQAVLFVGDDDTDEFVFAHAPAHWLTVRVERERASAARYFLHQQSGVAMLLDHLVKALQQRADAFDRKSQRA
jgi:trehalose 6-phosphate phosphatase